MSHVKKYLICYDIRDTKRLQRVHRTMRDVGVPVQLSVFEAELKSFELDVLLHRLTELIDEGQDRVSFYSLSNGYKKISLGKIDALVLV
jgi:CRISPR-associated protein Cas2